jgi:type IV pilus assembly protein PilE
MELIIAVSIVAILVGLAMPSYSRYIRKANRGEAQQLLLNWANNQEIWRAAHATYTDGSAQADGTQLPIPTHAKYNFFVRATASNPPVIGNCVNAAPTSGSYVLIACPQGDQANDEDKGVACNPIALNQSIGKTPVECW